MKAAVGARVALALLAIVCAVQIAVLLRQPAPSLPELPAAVDPALLRGAVELAPRPEEKLHSTDPAARESGARELIALIEARWPDDHRREFLVAIGPEALTTAVEHCIPPSVTIGQAVLESGWGRSGLAQDHNNIFGVKAGRSTKSVTMKTTEVDRGRAQRRSARFRTYDDWGASLEHHGALLGTDPRYAHARDRWEKWPEFLATVAPVYATDPAYVERVSDLVDTYRLDEFDTLVTHIARKRSDCAL